MEGHHRILIFQHCTSTNRSSSPHCAVFGIPWRSIKNYFTTAACGIGAGFVLAMHSTIVRWQDLWHFWGALLFRRLPSGRPFPSAPAAGGHWGALRALLLLFLALWTRPKLPFSLPGSLSDFLPCKPVCAVLLTQLSTYFTYLAQIPPLV